MNQQVTTCQLLCKQKIPSSDLEFIKGAISEGYLVNWLVDGLPAAQYADRVSIGFQLGYVSEPEKVALNNHYDITISVHKQKLENRYTVVGVEVDPKSLRTRSDCSKSGAEPLLLGSESVDMEYSYTLKFKLSDTEWGTRWDHYLKMTDQKVHWFGMIDSVLVAFMLSGIVSMILFRTLRRDIIRYNELDVNEEAHEDFGWKLVHGDVFRPPRHRLLLSLLIGNGCQILLMSLCTIGFAALGFLSPASRGSMPTVMLVSYLLFGSVNGYVSTRFYKLFGGEAWRQAVTLTTLVLPGSLFAILLVLNLFLVYSNSSSAIPFGTLLAVFVLWVVVSLPLSLLGAYFGFKRSKMQIPVRTHQIPRQIPIQSKVTSKLSFFILGGLLPFGAIFVELFFIMNSIWANRTYYVFGFLLIVFMVMLITCSLVAILMTYLLLCAENYHWWWRSFFSGFSVGFYLFVYSIGFYITRLEFRQFSSTVIYFGWSFAISFLVGLLAGTIGILASFLFIRKIYSIVKVGMRD